MKFAPATTPVVFAPDPCSGSGTSHLLTACVKREYPGDVATSKRRTVLGDLRWVRNSDPLLTVLESTRENLDPIVNMRFPTRSVRWLTLRTFPLRDYEIAEFEIYGDGYVHETTYLTPILDFGQAVTWGQNTLARRHARRHSHRDSHPHRPHPRSAAVLRTQYQRRPHTHHPRRTRQHRYRRPASPHLRRR